MTSLKQLWRNDSLREFISFSAIGASGFVIEIGLLKLLLLLGLPVYIAATLPSIVAASSNWYWNRRFTFKQAAEKKMVTQWGQYLIAAAIGLVFNLAIFWFGYSIFHLQPIMAKIIATFLVWFWNFFANKLWTFRRALKV